MWPGRAGCPSYLSRVKENLCALGRQHLCLVRGPSWGLHPGFEVRAEGAPRRWDGCSVDALEEGEFCLPPPHDSCDIGSIQSAVCQVKNNIY